MQLPPVLRDLYLDRHPFIVVQKGAQVGVSEWMLNQVLWAADTLLGGRGNALYVMPTEAVMRDFVQARVDSAIAASAHLSARVHPELPVRAVDRTGLKRFGEAHAYFRGSDRGQLITVDADIVLLDEFDRMDPETLALAQQRIASSRLGWLRAASTPSAPETGINRLFLESDQRHYLLPCPGSVARAAQGVGFGRSSESLDQLLDDCRVGFQALRERGCGVALPGCLQRGTREDVGDRLERRQTGLALAVEVLLALDVGRADGLDATHLAPQLQRSPHKALDGFDRHAAGDESGDWSPPRLPGCGVVVERAELIEVGDTQQAVPRT